MDICHRIYFTLDMRALSRVHENLVEKQITWEDAEVDNLNEIQILFFIIFVYPCEINSVQQSCVVAVFYVWETLAIDLLPEYRTEAAARSMDHFWLLRWTLLEIISHPYFYPFGEIFYLSAFRG